MDKEKFLQIEAQKTPRGVAVVDYGETSVVLRDNLSAAELAVFAEKNAAVAFWLPANCTAKIYIEQAAEKNEQGTFFRFSYEVDGSSSKSNEDLVKVMEVEIPWILFCGGDWVVKFCPLGQIAICNNGTAECNPLLTEDDR